MTDIPEEINLRLHPEAIRQLQEIMRMTQIPTVGQALTRCIGDTHYFLKQREKGHDVLLRTWWGRYRKVIWDKGL